MSPPLDLSMDSHGDQHASPCTDDVEAAAAAVRSFSLDRLPREFVTFLETNDIDPAIYTVVDLPRYVRLNPDPHNTITATELAHQLGVPVDPVPGLESFCRLPANVRLHQAAAYKDGRIFGMDLSSGIAVYALDVQPGDHVLDICCAPGAKLCMIAGLLTNSGSVQSDRSSSSNQLQTHISGTVTGVDISNHRLATCRNLLKRHRLQQHARLFQADGTTFNVLRPSALDHVYAKLLAASKKTDHAPSSSKSCKQGAMSHGNEEDVDPSDVLALGARRQNPVKEDDADPPVTKKPRVDDPLLNITPVADQAIADKATRLESTTPPLDMATKPESTTSPLDKAIKPESTIPPFFAPKVLRKDPQLQGDMYKYDKVIVDAECTHDGSIAHILKYETWGWDSFHKNFMAQDRLDSLCELQRGLLANGFRLAKVGGTVVYSTCSLSRAQNEDIVAWFLASFRGQVELEPVPKEMVAGVTPAPCKKPDRRVIASALGWISTAGGDENDESEWRFSAEQEAEMARLEQQVVEGCLRFDPLASRTSGFFLVRFRKTC